MSEKTRIEIGLVLPAIPDARDACVLRLADMLNAKDGIETAHIADTEGVGQDQICVHYDPERISIGQVRELVKRAGAELDQRFGHLLLKSRPMHARQARTAESRARQITGVLEAAISPAGVLRIEFDRQATDEEAIRIALAKIGVQTVEKREQKGTHGELRRLAVEILPEK